jgi:hypothetical protein
MDDVSGNFADESTTMASENVMGASNELRKRRSTRIVQAVPLAVTGVDALGRPFTERTSTLIINCHGCRYQSKHYVLKNMWVTLEIPHPEGGQSARNVRGRVAWIQRPRTVRQLFQVALELEQPGNAWGMAFPPEDWFIFPEASHGATGGALPSMPTSGSDVESGHSVEPAPGFLHEPLGHEAEAPAGGGDNVRIFPSPVSATDASLQLARQMSRLLNDAKQQIQAAARDAATHAVSAERHTAFEQWEQKFAAARVEVVNEAERAIARLQQEAEVQARHVTAVAEELANKTRSELPQSVAPRLHEVAEGVAHEVAQRVAQEVAQEIASKLAEEGAAQRARLEQEAAGTAESLRALCQQADAEVSKLSAHRETVESQLQERGDAAQRVLDQAQQSLEERARGLEESQRAAEELVRRLQSELAAHDEKLRAAAQQSAEHLGALADTGSRAKESGDNALRAIAEAADAGAARLALSHDEAASRHAALQATFEANWRSQLASEMHDAKERWQELVGSAVQNSAAEAVANALGPQRDEAARGMEEHARQLRERLQEDAARSIHEQVDAQISAHMENQVDRQLAERIAEPLNQHLERYFAEHLEGRLQERIGTQLHGHAERHLAELRDATSRLVAETEQQLSSLRDAAAHAANEGQLHVASLRESSTHAADEAANRVAGLRASLEEFVNGSLKEQTEKLEPLVWRATEAIGRLEQFPSRLDSAQEESLHGFRAQVDDVLSLHRNELHRRSESLFEEINGRVRAAFAESKREALADFVEKISENVSNTLQPQLAQTHEAVQQAEAAVHRLAGGRSLLDAAMTLQQDRIRGFADEAFADSLARFRENLGSVEQVLQEASQAITDKGLAELEGRVEGVKHAAVEDLLKSSEWYEKKAQTHIQTATERAVEHAATLLREKAGEVSSAFAGEVDHASRSFVGHTQTQMEEVLRDAFERSRVLFAEAAETTEAAFTDEIQRTARQELAGFGEEVMRSASEMRSQLETARVELALRTTAEQEDFLRRFQAGMSLAMEGTVAEARNTIETSFAPLLDSVRGVSEAHQEEIRGLFQQAGEEAAERHREKLQGISNQWMLATVASLDQQARSVVSNIAATAEEQLRVACEQVFAGVGDSLRERMREISTGIDLKAKGKSA